MTNLTTRRLLKHERKVLVLDPKIIRGPRAQRFFLVSTQQFTFDSFNSMSEIFLKI
jgi:hypothetical protein